MSMYKRPAFWSLKKKEYVKPDEVFEKDGKYYLKSDNSDVEKQMKIATHNKKLFAYFPQVNNESKAIEIVITAGANSGVTGDKMLYTGVAGIVLSDLCQKAGIKVRISVFVGSSSNGAITGAIIPIKDFNSPIDQNVTALLTSDPRIFRKEMFQGIVANYSNFNISCPSNLGSLPSADVIRMRFEDKENLTLKNQVFKAEKVFYTSGIFSETAAINTIKEIVEQIK
jgi:hypothetical protein